MTKTNSTRNPVHWIMRLLLAGWAQQPRAENSIHATSLQPGEYRVVAGMIATGARDVRFRLANLGKEITCEIPVLAVSGLEGILKPGFSLQSGRIIVIQIGDWKFCSYQAS